MGNQERFLQPDSREGEIRKSKERQTSQNKVRSTLGHIDFADDPDNPTKMMAFDQGLDEYMEPLSSKAWVQRGRELYSHQSISTDALDHKLLALAEEKFGPGGDYENPELHKGILEILGGVGAVEQDKNKEGDPLAGTQFEGVPNEELWGGQSVFGEDGEQHAVSEGVAYREAFLYYAKATGLLPKEDA